MVKRSEGYGGSSLRPIYGPGGSSNLGKPMVFGPSEHSHDGPQAEGGGILGMLMQFLEMLGLNKSSEPAPATMAAPDAPGARLPVPNFKSDGQVHITHREDNTTHRAFVSKYGTGSSVITEAPNKPRSDGYNTISDKVLITAREGNTVTREFNSKYGKGSSVTTDDKGQLVAQSTPSQGAPSGKVNSLGT